MPLGLWRLRQRRGLRQRGGLLFFPGDFPRRACEKDQKNENESQPLLTSMPRTVAILLFDEIEVLDFAGPYEVFGVAQTAANEPLFAVHTVAETAAPIRGARHSGRFVREGEGLHPAVYVGRSESR